MWRQSGAGTKARADPVVGEDGTAATGSGAGQTGGKVKAMVAVLGD